MKYNLTDISVIKRIMRAHDMYFSKSLGQNFLINENIPKLIVEKSGLTEESGVIEIGPGLGTLTMSLAEKAKKVVAVELDKKLLPILAITLADYSNVKIINDDILKTDIRKIAEEELTDLKVSVCANLPYYVTTPIIMKLIEEPSISSIIVMVQKEVARRLCSPEGSKEYGAISIAVQYLTQAEILFDVPSENFMPKPKVDSAVIKLTRLEKPSVSVPDEKLFFDVVKGAFSQRRKTLVNSLCNFGKLHLSKSELLAILNNLEIREDVRAEMLSLKDFAALTNIIYMKEKQ